MQVQIFTCPYCGARVKYDGKANLVQCEYCDSNIIIGRDVPTPPVPPEPPVSEEEIKAWKINFKKWITFLFCSVILSYILRFLSSRLPSNSFFSFLGVTLSLISLVFLFISILILFILPPILNRRNPDKSKSTIQNCIKYYLMFILTHFTGLLIGGIITIFE